MDVKLNTILKEEAKAQISEVKRSVFYAGKPNGTETDLYIGRTRVIVRQGVVQSELPIDGPISKEIEGFIVGVRLDVRLDTSILRIDRIRGKYTLDVETTGTVESDGGAYIKVSCYGPTREKVVELYEQIRGGKIRPSDEYDQPQIAGGPDLLEETRGFLRVSHNEINNLKRELQDVQRTLDSSLNNEKILLEKLEETGAALKLSEENHEPLRQELENALGRIIRCLKFTGRLEKGIVDHNDFMEEPFFVWPWVNRKMVAKKIKEILDGANKK